MNGTPPGRHPRLCQCPVCVEARWARYRERLDEYRKAGVLPKSPEQTVMVREYTVHSHFRRNARHLTNDEGLRHHVEAYLEALLRRKKKP